MTVLTNALHFVYALEGFALMIRQRMRKKNASGATIPLLPGETRPCEYFQLAFLLSSFFFFLVSNFVGGSAAPARPYLIILGRMAGKEL